MQFVLDGKVIDFFASGTPIMKHSVDVEIEHLNFRDTIVNARISFHEAKK